MHPLRTDPGTDPLLKDTTSFQTPAAWPPMNMRTSVATRQRQHLHAPYHSFAIILIKKTLKGTDGATRVNYPPRSMCHSTAPSAV
jgi:hypothetical protein